MGYVGNIKMDPREIGCEDVSFIELSLGIGCRRPSVFTVLNLLDSDKRIYWLPE
jgi:hypothetical protein